MDKKTPHIQKEKKNPTNILLIIIILLLLGLAGFLFIESTKAKEEIEALKNDNTTIKDERTLIQDDLSALQDAYNAIETDNEDLKSTLDAEKAEVDKLIKEAKGKNWSIHTLKKKVAQLQNSLKEKYVIIDSLNTANTILQAENQQVRSALKDGQDMITDLEKEKEDLNNQVSIASLLKVGSITTEGINIKSNNTGKATTRAKRVDVIRTRITVLDNEITPPGNKDIYVRILSPDGKIFSHSTDDNSKFTFNGVTGLFSIKESINYQNKKQAVVLDWKIKEQLLPGTYSVTIYSEERDIARTSLELK